MTQPNSPAERLDKIIQSTKVISHYYHEALTTTVKSGFSKHLIDLGIAYQSKDGRKLFDTLKTVRGDLQLLLDSLDNDDANKNLVSGCIEDINTWARAQMTKSSPTVNTALQHSQTGSSDGEGNPTTRHTQVFPIPRSAPAPVFPPEPAAPAQTQGTSYIKPVQQTAVQKGASGVNPSLASSSSGRKTAARPALSLPDMTNPEPEASAPVQVPKQPSKGMALSLPDMTSRTRLGDGTTPMALGNQEELVTKSRVALLKDGYKIEKPLGQGGMGTVLKCQNVHLKRFEAVKIITVKGSQEAQIAAKFQDVAGVLPVYHAGEVYGNPYFAMLYLENVSDLTNLPEGLDMDRLLEIAQGMAQGVAGAHEKKVLHRDIKLANFLILGDKTYLTDFGIAIDLAQTPEPRGSAGTPRYMAPEQATKFSKIPLSPKTDVFSLGISFYELFTGASPYEEKANDPSPEVICEHISHLKGSAIKSSDKLLQEKGVPKEICLLLARMTNVNPDKRPESSEVYEVIKEYLYKQSPEYKEAEENKQTSAFRAKIAKILGGVLVIGALSGGLYIPYAKKQSSRQEFFQAADRAKKNVDDLMGARQWSEAIALLNTEIQKLNNTEVLDASEKRARLEALQSQLTEAQTKFEALSRARALIVEGDLLLDPKLPNGQPDPNTPSNLDGARTKYRLALTTSNEVSAEITEKLLEVDRRECRQSYTRGVRHYNRGEIQETNREFAAVNRLRMVGLSEQQRGEFQERRHILENWDQRIVELRRDVIRTFEISDLNQFKSVVDEWKAQVQQGNRDSLTRIIELRIYLDNNKPTIYRQIGNRNDSTPITDANELINHPDWIMYLNKKRYLDDYVKSIYKLVTDDVQNPRIVGSIETVFYNIIDVKKLKLRSLIEQRKYDEYLGELIHVLNFVRCLDYWTENNDLIEINGAPNTRTYLTAYLNDLFLTAVGNLPRSNKQSLLTNLEQEFSDNLLIISIARTHLSVR